MATKFATERMYVRRSFEQTPTLGLQRDFMPGDALPRIISEFYESGVAPDFIPAELGEDGQDDFTVDGDPIVDPRGDIRTDMFEFRDRALVDGFAESAVPKRFGVVSPSTGTDVPPAGESAVESPEIVPSEGASE